MHRHSVVHKVSVNKVLVDKLWAKVDREPPEREMRAGITGIEKKLNQKVKQDTANISKAFDRPYMWPHLESLLVRRRRGEESAYA